MYISWARAFPDFMASANRRLGLPKQLKSINIKGFAPCGDNKLSLQAQDMRIPELPPKW